MATQLLNYIYTFWVHPLRFPKLDNSLKTSLHFCPHSFDYICIHTQSIFIPAYAVKLQLLSVVWPTKKNKIKLKKFVKIPVRLTFFPACVHNWFDLTCTAKNGSRSISGLFLTHMCKAYGVSLRLCVNACVWIRNNTILVAPNGLHIIIHKTECYFTTIIFTIWCFTVTILNLPYGVIGVPKLNKYRK